MHDLIRRFLREANGATVVEYGLILAVLSLAIIGGFGHAAEALNYLFGNNASQLQQTLAP